METFLVNSAAGGASLTFCERVPLDPQEPIEEFSVQMEELNLLARGHVWTGYTYSHPAPLFVEMAQKWAGWRGDLTWESLEQELRLSCTHDGLGHIQIGIEYRSDPMNGGWYVRTNVMVEAGQLELLAKQAVAFFGSPWEPPSPTTW